MPDRRQLAAEFSGTALLLATVAGSGIMAEQLAGGNLAIALLANALATGAMLVVLIGIFGPVSGAHFNPAVSMVMALGGRLGWTACAGFCAVQIAGAVFGVLAAHAMFDLPLVQVSAHVRSGTGQWLSEFIATFGLVLTIFGTLARAPNSVAAHVGLYIIAAYWFTASTSFANPAVTLARSLTNTFSGIAPSGIAPFLLAQITGALAGWLLAQQLWADQKKQD